MALGSFGDSDSQNGFLSPELKARCELGRISLSLILGSSWFSFKDQWRCMLHSVVGQQSVGGGGSALWLVTLEWPHLASA